VGGTIRLVIDIPDWLENILIQPLLLYRRARYGYCFRRIPLTRGQFAIVDPEDYWKLNKYKWHTVANRGPCYAGRTYRDSKTGKRRFISMHRWLIEVPPSCCLDHINHNGLDNRRANLRPATISQNCCNRRKTSSKTWSRYKGVSWRIRDKRWSAEIKIAGNSKFLGLFRNETSAAKAYDAAAGKYHGRFAVLNFEAGK